MVKINPSTKLRVNTKQSQSIRKAVIPIAGLGTRFLPLSKVLPKELWPLVDKPVIQYIVEEVAASGIKEIIFVIKPGRELVSNYFKKKLKSKKTLLAKYKNHFLNELKNLEKLYQKISFSQTLQRTPLGSAHAVLKAKNLLKNEPCAVLWADDVVESKIPCLLEIINIFKKYRKPIIGLYRVSKEDFQFYGMIEGKRVAPQVYKIKRIAEKPLIKDAPSNLAVVGRYIITPEVFDYLKKTPFLLETDVTLSETLGKMAENGEEIYGYEIKGKWLECGNKLAYLKSNLYLSLKHPQFSQELRKYLRGL